VELDPLSNEIIQYSKEKRNKDCTNCELHKYTKNVCIYGEGKLQTKGMIVFDSPNDVDDVYGRIIPTKARQYLEQVLADEGIELSSLYSTYSTKCRVSEFYTGKEEAAMKTCTSLYLDKEIEDIKPIAILSLGKLPFYFFQHRAGLDKRRGQIIEYPLLTETRNVKVVPTFTSEYILTNPQYHDLFISDIAKFARIIKGENIAPKVNIIHVENIDQFNSAITELVNSKKKVFTFDTETRGFKDYLPEYSKMWTMAITVGDRDEKGIRVFHIPLEHPQSPFSEDRELMKKVVTKLCDVLFNNKINNHNVVFDLRHLIRLSERYNYTLPINFTIAFDTMVAAHLLNEELPLSLLNVAGSELGVDNWGKGIQQWGDDGKPPSDLWGENGMGSYCGFDVGYTHLLYEKLAGKLRNRQSQALLMKNLILPAMKSVLQMQLNGIWVDPEKVSIERKQLLLDQIELKNKVLSFIPEDFRETADIDNAFFLRKWLFSPTPDGLGLVPISTTEKTGQAQVNEATLKRLVHPAIKSLLELKKVTKLLQFFVQWQEFIDNDNRIHPYFNLTGTVTGRRSCDRPNLQQVPRDARLRGCLGAPKGWKLIEVDFSMVEVRIAAWFSEEENLLAIFKEGGDAYRKIASLVLGIKEENVTKEDRQKGKAIVLGFIYGMSHTSFKEYARDMFGVEVTIEEAKLFKDRFFEAFPDLVRWHERTKRYVIKHRSIESPIGRNRNLIRVLSDDSYQQWLAKAQGINCVDFETEILSKRGWLYYNQLNNEDLVLTKNFISNELEWEKVEKINIYPEYEGEIIEFKSKSFNALTTSNHRWLTTSKSTGKNREVTSENIGIWGDNRIHRTGNYVFPEISIYNDYFISLCGWILTDGHFKTDPKYNLSTISLTQSNRANSEKVKIIDNIFKSLNIKHKKSHIKWSDCFIWSFTDETAKQIRQLLPNKRLNIDFICSLTRKQAELLLEAMMLGDGTEGRRFICADKEQTDLFQILCSLLGIATTVYTKDNSKYERKLSENMKNIPKPSIVNLVSLLKRNKTQIVEGQFEKRNEKIGVWCPTVENSFWVARRRGSVFITGNSPVQGLGGDLTLNAMNELHKIMPLSEGLLVGDIHDAVLYQIREDKAEEWGIKIAEIMENPAIFKKYNIVPPVKLVANVKIGQYWGEGIEYTVENGSLVQKN